MFILLQGTLLKVTPGERAGDSSRDRATLRKLSGGGRVTARVAVMMMRMIIVLLMVATVAVAVM